MVKSRAFSLYDIEEFLKEAGAEKVNERAIMSFEEELEHTVKELVADAEIYAQYAGRSKINPDDVSMVNEVGKSSKFMIRPSVRLKRRSVKRQKQRPIQILTAMDITASQF